MVSGRVETSGRMDEFVDEWVGGWMSWWMSGWR